MTLNSNKNILVISGHDYRSKRQTNIHFISRELAKEHSVRFFSVGFSMLSKIKKDPRLSLSDRVNCVEKHNGVECYLWRSLVHPVNLDRLRVGWLESLWFRWYVFSAPYLLKRWVREASVVIIESGLGVAFVRMVKKLNPQARLIYRCSDNLDTISCASFLKRELERQALLFDKVAVVSGLMSGEFPDGTNLQVVPHGLDKEAMLVDTVSPYHGGTNAVSVGSMLFDPQFFHFAAPAFPEVVFHVIGGGKRASQLNYPNVRVYPEMPFLDTLPYLQHADVGIAPYEGNKVSPYLVDTSLKLTQFSFLGLPAVCPEVTAGGREGREGYLPDNLDSICFAMQAALAKGRGEFGNALDWGDVSKMLIFVNET